MNQVDIMNQIPEDIVGHIMSFIYDKRGYHYIDYKRRKRKMDFKMKRVIAELILFQTDYQGEIRILKPIRIQRQKYKKFLNNLQDGKSTITYHTGLYMNIRWERNWIKKMAEQEEILSYNQKREVIWRLGGRYGWKVTINRPKPLVAWKNTYKRMERKAQQENQKWKSSRRMLNNNVIESSKKWNQSMAAAANSLL